MCSEMVIRREERSALMQILMARHESKTPRDFSGLLSWAKAKMEPDDVRRILLEFEEWKNSL